ncbi:MAG TPA: hypothetical protein GXX34_11550 [Clostridia bacterium]|nr:hypothetical protein [Clostridia bacterium]
MPAVFAGKPDNVKSYEYTQVDGLNVYIDKTVPVHPEGLQVDLKGFGLFKRLVVDGFMV